MLWITSYTVYKHEIRSYSTLQITKTCGGFQLTVKTQDQHLINTWQVTHAVKKNVKVFKRHCLCMAYDVTLLSWMVTSARILVLLMRK